MIDGFSIAGYRSFGKSEVRIADLSRVNIFIGKNNCGKSNILRFLKRIGVALKRPPSPAPNSPPHRWWAPPHLANQVNRPRRRRCR